MVNIRHIGLIAALCASVLALPAHAEQYRFNYSKLYTQMKNNLEEGHPDVKVAFFFQEHQTSRLCKIDKAWMEKDKHYEEFVIPPSQELIVPLDNNLRQVGPLVYVNAEQGKTCDFSMVVMTKQPLSGEVSYQDIESLLPQMSKMLDDLGGMFSSWFAPKVIGLTLEFDGLKQGAIQTSKGNTFPIDDGKAKVSLAELSEDESLLLPQATFRALPLLEK
ncbi:DUF2987 domain-containing protein [Vibrio sp. CK2-1]|uniref:DUF2987 domain-containing protein n=1 Tax=Vibrio sp. CK2-1 TaxID=2912249 RepID=UPI001F220F5A|nr:DUF2987 domain-containing protein [Vibrio sp. CK2-1]MCF7353388.1 DUF2987 domain-containing protein [Vibrio sp. CK2-1]